MNRKFSEKEIKKLVEDTLTSPAKMIIMLVKHDKTAAPYIDHGQLHLDFDNRENSSWNDDIINLFHLDRPVTMTSWKGNIYVHCLNEAPIDCSCMGTREIMEMIVKKHGVKTE
jgi:hypothetical protein